MLPAPLKVLPQKFLGIETHPIGTSKTRSGPGTWPWPPTPLSRQPNRRGSKGCSTRHSGRSRKTWGPRHSGRRSFEKNGPRWHNDCGGFATDVPVAPLSGLGEGDCHASCHKGTIGFSVNFGALRCRLRPGRRQRRYGRRRRHSGRQWRWTRWNWNNNSKWKRHYRFNIHDVAPEHNGNIVRRCAAENECGKDGRACLSQRNKETLLRTLRSPLAATRLPLLATDSKRRHHAHYTSLRLSK